MKRLFTLLVSALMVLGLWIPASAEGSAETNGELPVNSAAVMDSADGGEASDSDTEAPVYSVSVDPEKVSLPFVKEGYEPQEPKYITIKNTGNQTIILEDYGKDPWLVITLDKNTLEPNEEATVSIKLKDDLSAVTQSTLKGFITYTSEDGTVREHARFNVTYAVSHDMKYVEAKEPTHLEDGNISCWYCEYCDKYYKSAAGTNELSLEEITITKLKEHTPDDSGWHSDETNHWNTCECGEKLNEAAHTFEWVIDKEATATENASKHEECTVCGYAKAAVEIPATGTAEEPTEPTEPSTPEEPTEPTEPSKPEDPTEPTKPSKPEETPSEPSKGESQTDDSKYPQTGDNKKIALWAAGMLAAGAALTGAVLYGRKEKYNK